MSRFQALDRARPLTYQEIADGCGESKRTIEKIARREIQNPGVDHCDALAAFFRELDAMPGANERERYEALVAKRKSRKKVAA